MYKKNPSHKEDCLEAAHIPFTSSSFVSCIQGEGDWGKIYVKCCVMVLAECGNIKALLYTIEQ